MEVMISVCAVCDTATDKYFTCPRNMKDYCMVHLEHGYHGCTNEKRDTPSSYAMCGSCDAVVTQYFFCVACAKDYCILHRDHETHRKQDPNAETSLSIEAIVRLFGGPT